MNNKELFKQAILDAKSVREAALVNAKKALEESLTPQLQNMLALKLQEMEAEVEEGDDPKNEDLEENESLDEEFDLDEILKELENESEETNESDNLDEKEELEEGDDDLPATGTPHPEDAMAADNGAEAGAEGGVSDDEKLESLTVADLKDLLRSVIAQELSGAEGGEVDGDMDPNLSGEEGGENAGEEDPDTDPSELDAPSKHAAKAPGFKSQVRENDDEVDLDELLQELEAMDAINERKKAKSKDKKGKAKPKEDDSKDKEKADKKDLAEAIKTIQYLGKELSEVNLLNAKLLYVNKIFKSKNLTESQKTKVIFAFDKANSVKETKLVYETLLNSVVIPGAKPLAESRGFASKSAGLATKQPTPIVNSEIERWQFLAGIKKNKY